MLTIIRIITVRTTSCGLAIKTYNSITITEMMDDCDGKKNAAEFENISSSLCVY